MSAQKKILFVIAFLFFAGLVFYAGIGSADSQISKLGTGFSSATGSYATSTHCVSGQTCGWLSTNEILIGAYNYDPVTWGGSAKWSFDLSGIEDVVPRSQGGSGGGIEWGELQGTRVNDRIVQLLLST